MIFTFLKVCEEGGRGGREKKEKKKMQQRHRDLPM